MSIQALSWVIERSESTRGARCVMFAVANHADEYGGNCWASVETLARESRLSERGTQYALRQLTESGELEQTGESPFGTRVYRIRGVQETAEGVQEPAEIVSETAPKPSYEPSKEPIGAVGDEVDDVFDYFLAAFNPRSKTIDAGQRKIIQDALVVASVDELTRAIQAAAESDWHQKRGEFANRPGKKHNTLSAILKPKQRSQMGDGYTQRERIDFWLDREPAPAGPSQEEIDKWNLANARFANGTGPDPGPSPWEKEEK